MKNTSLKDSRHIRKYADWSVVILRICATFFKYRATLEIILAQKQKMAGMTCKKCTRKPPENYFPII